ncbi:MAG: T9SS type A sorting domain-containing protein [Bacteroides sp.]|jgi:hypothetical protein|nr:T9SS type A sorting domain-containing protein [Bacteroides sp.]
MKKNVIFFLALILPLITMAQNPDPVLIRTGSQFQFNTFSNFTYGCYSNFFQDNQGVLHGAYVDNYELFYFFSEDDGNSWEVEQVMTGYEGKIKNAGIVADSNGGVFIPFEVHPNYNYGQSPTGYPEFIYQIYCAKKVEEGWTFDLVFNNEVGSNRGYNLGDVLIDENDKVHIFASKYGWFLYGGEVSLAIRDPESGDWTTELVVAFNDTPVDNTISNPRASINENGDLAVVFWRSYFSRIDYCHKPSGGSWSAAQTIHNAPNANRSYTIAAGTDGEFHLLYELGDGTFPLYYKSPLEPGPGSVIYTPEADTRFIPTLHIDQSGKSSVIIQRTAPNAPLLLTKEYINDEWEENFEAFATEELITAPFVVKRPQGQYTYFHTLFIKYFRSDTGIHGPDTIYFWKAFNMKELTLVSEPEGSGELLGAGEYPIESAVTVNAEPVGDYMFLQWEDADGNILSTEPDFEFTMPLDHATLTAVFQSTASVDPITAKPPVQIYPNPSPDGIFKLVLDRDMSVRVVNMNGRTVASSRLKEGDNTLDLSGKPSGIYALEFFGKETSLTVRIMIQ